MEGTSQPPLSIYPLIHCSRFSPLHSMYCIQGTRSALTLRDESTDTETFLPNLDSLLTWVCEIEELTANQKPPSSEVKVVKAQLQEQKVISITSAVNCNPPYHFTNDCVNQEGRRGKLYLIKDTWVISDRVYIFTMDVYKCSWTFPEGMKRTCPFFQLETAVIVRSLNKAKPAWSLTMWTWHTSQVLLNTDTKKWEQYTI
jgi:hypothetical protein